MSKELPEHQVVDTISKFDFKLSLYYGRAEEYFFSMELNEPLSLAITEDGKYFLKNSKNELTYLVVEDSVVQSYFGDADSKGKSSIDIVQEFIIKSCGYSNAYIKVEAVDDRVPFYADCKHFSCSWRKW